MPTEAGPQPTTAGHRDAVDRALYALFSRHADRRRHDRDRSHYRGAALLVSFEVYLARVYACSWLVALPIAWLAVVVVVSLSGEGATARTMVPILGTVSIPTEAVAAVAGLCCGLAAKRGVRWVGSTYLRWRTAARRAAIERTFPGAVRYLRALATGTDDRRVLLDKVARGETHGETGVAFRSVLNRAALTGSLDTGLRDVARDTPSRALLAPFLLKFREHSNQGSDALRGYLRMESRMLSHRQARARQRATDALELVAELFVVLLVVPALLVVVLTVLSVLAPGLSAPVDTPVGETTVRALVVYGSAVTVLVVGASAAALVADIRPAAQSPPRYERPTGVALVRTALSNPASAALAWAPVAVGVGIVTLFAADVLAGLVGAYVVYGVAVGSVSLRRARRDDAKDREMRDFVHAVAGHVGLGTPFPTAVERVARGVDLGALQSDVEALAFSLSLSGTDGTDADVRRVALDRFVDRVGTPLAEQTIGLVTGALDVGSDSEAVFETLQTAVGRLHHERKALRSAMLVYVAVGWTTALLVVGIMVAVEGHVLSGFAQLTTVSETSSVALVPGAIDPERDGRRFYLVTQATMLACGWFAGTASRGRYEALLHSALLVFVCHLVFATAGVV